MKRNSYDRRVTAADNCCIHCEKKKIETHPKDKSQNIKSSLNPNYLNKKTKIPKIPKKGQKEK